MARLKGIVIEEPAMVLNDMTTEFFKLFLTVHGSNCVYHGCDMVLDLDLDLVDFRHFFANAKGRALGYEIGLFGGNQHGLLGNVSMIEAILTHFVAFNNQDAFGTHLDGTDGN
jgi:hypothetical protein